MAPKNRGGCRPRARASALCLSHAHGRRHRRDWRACSSLTRPLPLSLPSNKQSPGRHKYLSTQERLLACWMLCTGLIHLIVEGELKKQKTGACSSSHDHPQLSLPPKTNDPSPPLPLDLPTPTHNNRRRRRLPLILQGPLRQRPPRDLEGVQQGRLALRHSRRLHGRDGGGDGFCVGPALPAPRPCHSATTRLALRRGGVGFAGADLRRRFVLWHVPAQWGRRRVARVRGALAARAALLLVLLCRDERHLARGARDVPDPRRAAHQHGRGQVGFSLFSLAGWLAGWLVLFLFLRALLASSPRLFFFLFLLTISFASRPPHPHPKSQLRDARAGEEAQVTGGMASSSSRSRSCQRVFLFAAVCPVLCRPPRPFCRVLGRPLNPAALPSSIRFFSLPLHLLFVVMLGGDPVVHHQILLLMKTVSCSS